MGYSAKKAAAIAIAMLALAGCGAGGAPSAGEISLTGENGSDNISETETSGNVTEMFTEASQTETEISETESETAEITAAKTETPPEETADAANAKEKLPANTREIDLVKDYKKYSLWKVERKFVLLDDKTLCVLYSVDDEEEKYSDLRVFDLENGKEKAYLHFDELFTEIEPYDLEGGMVRLYKSYNSHKPDSFDRTCAEVMRDFTYINAEYPTAVPYFTGHGHNLLCGKGQIIDADTGKLLVDGVFDLVHFDSENGGFDELSKSSRISSPDFFIDDNRFVYTVYGWEWIWETGIYDYRTGEAKAIPVPELEGEESGCDLYTFGCKDGKIYSEYASPEAGVTGCLCVTDPDTLETKKLADGNDDMLIYRACMADDGSYIIADAEDNGGQHFVFLDPDDGRIIGRTDFGNRTVIYADSDKLITQDFGKLWITDCKGYFNG